MSRPNLATKHLHRTPGGLERIGPLLAAGDAAPPASESRGPLRRFRRSRAARRSGSRFRVGRQGVSGAARRPAKTLREFSLQLIVGRWRNSWAKAIFDALSTPVDLRRSPLR
jgi:hypothetical protein